MEAKWLFSPEFDLLWNHTVADPIWRSRHLFDAEFRSIEGDFFYEVVSVLHRPRLPRCPCSYLSQPWTCRKICVGFLVTHHLNVARHPNLLVDRHPVETEGGLRVAFKILTFAALAVRIENKAAVSEILEENHSHRRTALDICSCKSHRRRLIYFCFRRFFKPTLEKLNRVFFDTLNLPFQLSKAQLSPLVREIWAVREGMKGCVCF